MIIEYIRYTIAPDQAQDFIESYSRAMVHLMQSPYAKWYEIARCAEESDRFIVRIHWSSQEDHMEKFRKSAEFKAFFALVKPYFKAIEEMHHYDVVEASGENADV